MTPSDPFFDPHDCVKEGEKEALLIVEGIWQNKLATFEANGNINKKDEMKK